ncbi:MAG: chloride channel protein [Calditrichia bacterium]
MYAILGLSAGLVSLYYLRYTDQVSRILRLSAISKTPRWLRMTTVGLLVGICGYYYPLIFGVGYDAINAMLADALSWKTVFVLLLMKFVLVPMVLGVGGFGGIFAPSLFMGGCLGFLFATSLNVLGGMSLDITAFVLVGMGADLRRHQFDSHFGNPDHF